MRIESEKMDRISVWLVSAIAVVVVVGGVFQVRSYLFVQERTLLAPTRALIAEQLENQEPEEGSAEASLTDLQAKDTDGDTISDFDELYVHNTSPYLADTDSDGVDDAQELADGTEPTCPEGEACEQERTTAVTGSAAEKAFDEFSPDDLLPKDADGNVDAEELRRILIEQGVPEDVVNETDDATLVQAYEETSALTKSGGNAVVNIKDQAEEIKNLSIEEKKQLLLQTGASIDEVNTLSDEEINQLFESAVDEAMQATLQEDALPDSSVGVTQ